MVVIDLKLDAMQPKRPYYERVRWSFENVLNKEYEFLVAYFDSVTGESAPIEFPESSEAKQIPTAVTTKILDDVKIPTTEVVWDHSLASANSRKGGALLTGAEVWQSDCYDVYEWLGMVSIESERIAATDRVDPFVSVYSVPEPHAQGPVCLVRCTGMLERHGIVGITVWGFEDAPISWYSHIHSYYLSGENMYAQIRNKEKKMCLTFQACCPYDTFS
ncbi:hypothetical protein EV182_003434 [Spiromyces aspiralis]|uniref:Uncharacterized protein n=1 Tax=Spiromyces aspiralis TaxID=68401 RepID=A0ACC1HUH1_9FUNG|nr:hypothetical protein EV182_003434 [Spiromyces aspiralis]